MKIIEALLNNFIVRFFLKSTKFNILKHNEISIDDYPETTWNLVPFPAQKGNVFNFDNLSTVNRHSFIDEYRFVKALSAAEGRWKDNGGHVRNITWRLHIMLWAVDLALSTAKENEIFVECGTGKGYMAAGIAEYFNWGEDKPAFYLIDSFKNTMPNELGDQTESGNELFVYADGDSEVKKYFSKYNSVNILTGFIPDILINLPPTKIIRFLHIDLNSCIAEMKALENLVSRFDKGTVILFDDFGGPGGIEQAELHENFAKINSKFLLQLPTGQAMIVW